MTDYNSASVLVELARKTTALPTARISEILEHDVKHSSPVAKSLFGISDILTSVTRNGKTITFQVFNFALAYICWEMSFISEHGFSSRVDGVYSKKIWTGFLQTLGSTVGKEYFFEKLRRDTGEPNWNTVLSHRDAIIADLPSSVGSDQFIATAISRLNSNANFLELKLLLLFIRELSDSAYSSILALFQSKAPIPFAGILNDPSIDFFDGLTPIWMGGGNAGRGMHHDHLHALATEEIVHHHVQSYSYSMGGIPGYWTSDFPTKTVAPKVNGWFQNQGPEEYGTDSNALGLRSQANAMAAQVGWRR